MEELPDGWQSGGRVIWKKLDVSGQHHWIAGGPRGVFLWSQGNSGVDIPTVAVDALWRLFADKASQTYVVKVRRRRWGLLSRQVLRQDFPRSRELLDCVREVETELRRGSCGSAPGIGSET